MKKIFIFAATAALLASCAQDELINEVDPSNVEQAIGFGTDMSNMTRAENSTADYLEVLYRYHKTFGVWGYKTVGTAAEQNVFNNQTCTWTTGSTGPFDSAGDWVYSPIRYWDKTAKYDFYAYAPSTVPFAIAGTAPHYLTLNTYTVAGKSLAQNLNNPTPQATTTNTSNDVFGEVNQPNEDLMIADDVIGATYNPQRVNLHFNHILSRLNIAVTTNIPTAVQYSPASGGDPEVLASGATVTLNALKVFNMKTTGKFDEHLKTGADLKAGTTERWYELSTPNTTGVGVSFDEDGKATTTDYAASAYVPEEKNNVVECLNGTSSNLKYFYQGLVMPQEVKYEPVALDGTDVDEDSEPYLYMNYTIAYASGETETYKVYYNLASIFTNVEAIYVTENGRNAYKDTKSGNYYYIDATGVYANATATEAIAANTVIYTTGTKYYLEGTMTTELTETTPGTFTDEDGNTYTPDVILSLNPAKNKDMNTIDPAASTAYFCEGWQNNLKITISPLAILFSADVYKWADYVPAGDITVE